MRAEAQNSGGLKLGGVSLGFGQNRILLAYKILVGCYLGFFYFTARAASFEALFSALLLILAAFLPGYLWCAGKAKGLPIVPALALYFIPTYALPVQTASKVLKAFSPEEQAEGILIAAGYLLLITVVWHQACNRESRPEKSCFMIDPAKSANWMLAILAGYLVLQLVGNKLPQGLFTLLRGIFMNGTALACFILSFYAGQKKLSSPVQTLFFLLVTASILIEAAGLILASSLVRLAILIAGYGLGSGRIPWKRMGVLVGLIWLLHAGKAQMREEFWQEGVMGTTKAEIWDYPKVFGRWLELGWEKTFAAKKEDTDDQTAAERGSLLNVFLKIKSMTPSKVAYLEGLTYREIPKLLVPRFLNKEKGFSHIGNMWLAYLYGFTSEENLTRVSIQFDLMMEGYANFGLSGVAGIAVVVGIFLGMVGRMSTGVPLMSLRFFFAILVLNTFLGTNNTMGVFITTLWQGSIGLILLSVVMMKKLPNPLYAKPEALRKGLRIEDRGLGGGSGPTLLQTSPTREELRRVEDEGAEGGRSPSAQGLGGREAPGAGDSLDPQSTILNPEEATAPVRHERPTRFVYGEKK